MAAAVVGKGGNRAGNLAGIGNLVLEVLMLVFALGNEVLNIMALLGFHCRLINNKNYKLREFNEWHPHTIISNYTNYFNRKIN